jgi:uncharacterized RDD family membrane protein YckC
LATLDRPTTPANRIDVKVKESTPHRSERPQRKTTVTKICSQCGAVLSKGARNCVFCDISDSALFLEGSTATKGNLALNAVNDTEWRGQLNQRVQAYRARRRKSGDHEAQAELAFSENAAGTSRTTVEIADPAGIHPAIEDDFSFTIAIGRPARKATLTDTQYLIDVSLPPNSIPEEREWPEETRLPEYTGMYPVATIDERRSAAFIDAACLAFAYGGFLALFGSLGGHFTLSKLNAAVYFFTFAFVYLQYFGLFTIFGGTTPGMMIRGLRVATFSGDEPTLRHLLLRAGGYVLSAGTLFLGFLWALWDEDALTWHDRLSGTYLRAPEIFAELDKSHPADSRQQFVRK